MFLIGMRFSTYLDLYVFMKHFVRLTSSPKPSKGLLPAAPQERYSSNSGLIERLPRSSPLANDKPNWLFDKPNLFFCEFFIWDIWEASGRAAIFKDNKQDWKKIARPHLRRLFSVVKKTLFLRSAVDRIMIEDKIITKWSGWTTLFLSHLSLWPGFKKAYSSKRHHHPHPPSWL